MTCLWERSGSCGSCIERMHLIDSTRANTALEFTVHSVERTRACNKQQTKVKKASIADDNVPSDTSTSCRRMFKWLKTSPEQPRDSRFCSCRWYMSTRAQQTHHERLRAMAFVELSNALSVDSSTSVPSWKHRCRSFSTLLPSEHSSTMQPVDCLVDKFSSNVAIGALSGLVVVVLPFAWHLLAVDTKVRPKTTKPLIGNTLDVVCSSRLVR